MARAVDRPFRVSWLVQTAGLVSLLSIPLTLAVLVWALLQVSVALGIFVGLAFTVGLQAAVARRWGTFRARPADRRREPELFATVERLCSAADLSAPAIVVHEEPYANSWISGLTSKRAKLHLTRGLIDRLDSHQLSAVVAHELAHVRQRDAVLMTIAGTPVAALTDGAGFYFHAYATMGQLWRDRRTVAPLGTPMPEHPDYAESQASANAQGVVGLVIYWGAAWLVMLPVALLFLVFGSLASISTAAFSRAREMEADAAAALLTANPAALSSALIALSDIPHDLIPMPDLRKAASLDVFHIVALAKERPLLHTHPSLKRRLAQLATIEARLQHS